MSNCELPIVHLLKALAFNKIGPLIEGKSLHVSHFFSFRVISTHPSLNSTSASSTQHQPQLNSRIGDKDHRKKGKWTLNCFLFCFVFNQIFIGTNWSMGQAFLYPQNVFFYAKMYIMPWMIIDDVKEHT